LQHMCTKTAWRCAVRLVLRGVVGWEHAIERWATD